MQLRLKAFRGVIAGLAWAWALQGFPQSPSPFRDVEPAHLKAVHEARAQLAKDRKPVFDNGLYQDYRVVIHVVGSNDGLDGAIYRGILQAARDTGVNVVMLATPSGYRSSSERGMHEGALFISGSIGISDRELWFPGSGEASSQGFRVADKGSTGDLDRIDALDLWPRVGFDSGLFLRALDSTGGNPQRALLMESAQRYPDEFLGADCWQTNRGMQVLDSELARRHCSAVAVSRGPVGTNGESRPIDGYQARFRHLTTHVLCRDLTESGVIQALKAGRSYLSHDWLCDPTSFAFVAVHNLGVFTLGDAAPANRLIGGGTTLIAGTPVPAHIRLYHKNHVVADTTGSRLDFDANDPGAYRVEAALVVDGQERPWIYSNPIYLDNSVVSTTTLPPTEKPAGVDVKRGIVYSGSPSPDPNKHKLDVYWPKGATHSPVFLFIHGGAWRFGDRTQFFAVGNRFARDGFVTVVPSYRLAPRSPYPAQIDDCAEALAWTIREIGAYGGDTNRIFIGGHSAGGHLAALLALDRRHLESRGFSPQYIKGVIGMSGVYDLNAIGDSQSEVFGTDSNFRRASSPITYVHEHAPPFLITYCEHDYFSLPAQARDFAAALRLWSVKTELRYSPGENHVAEIFSFCLDHDPTADAMLRFMGK